MRVSNVLQFALWSVFVQIWQTQGEVLGSVLYHWQIMSQVFSRLRFIVVHIVAGALIGKGTVFRLS